MIEEHRKAIDKLDSELVRLLADRLELSRKIGEEKRSTGEEIHVRTREIAILDRVKLYGDQLGLDEDFLTSLYQVILAESRRIQGA